jgi:hypothetical protein
VFTPWRLLCDKAYLASLHCGLVVDRRMLYNRGAGEKRSFRHHGQYELSGLCQFVNCSNQP